MDDQVSGTRFVPAPPEAIFELLARPAQHPAIDGSGILVEARTGAERLSQGAKFGMGMKIFGVVPWNMHNTVEEFEEGRLIAWRHFGKHRWRYELEPVDGGTQVTETCDFSTAPAWRRSMVKRMGKDNLASIEATLDRLVAHFTAEE